MSSRGTCFSDVLDASSHARFAKYLSFAQTNGNVCWRNERLQRASETTSIIMRLVEHNLHNLAGRIALYYPVDLQQIAHQALVPKPRHLRNCLRQPVACPG